MCLLQREAGIRTAFCVVYDFKATLRSGTIPALIRECSSKALSGLVTLGTSSPKAFASATW